MATPPRARDQLDMKLHNRTMIWNLIFNSRPISRAQLAKTTSMSPTSITRIVAELAAFGLLKEQPDTQISVGRKATMLDIDKNALFSVGIDIDVEMIKTCLLDLDNQPRIILDRKLADSAAPPETVVDIAREMYDEMLAASAIDEDRIKVIGVSVSGMIDRAEGVVKASPQLRWKNVRLRDLIERRFAAESVFENDVKAAIYEKYTRHKGCRADNVCYLTIGSGIGAALMYNGEIFRGRHNAAGEVGHITVRPGGELCDCGRHGCLYTCLSEKAVLRTIRRLSSTSHTFNDWITAHREGEAWAVGLTNEIAGYIAMALNHILCCYDPQVIIVGGRILNLHPELLDLALAKKGFIYEDLLGETKILGSASPNDDAVVGAAILAKSVHLDKLLHSSMRNA